MIEWMCVCCIVQFVYNEDNLPRNRWRVLMLSLTGSMLSALGVVIIQRTAALSLNWDPEGFCWVLRKREMDGKRGRQTERERAREMKRRRERISARRGVRVGIKVKHIKNSPAGPTHSWKEERSRVKGLFLFTPSPKKGVRTGEARNGDKNRCHVCFFYLFSYVFFSTCLIPHQSSLRLIPTMSLNLCVNIKYSFWLFSTLPLQAPSMRWRQKQWEWELGWFQSDLLRPLESLPPHKRSLERNKHGKWYWNVNFFRLYSAKAFFFYVPFFFPPPTGTMMNGAFLQMYG